MPEKMRLKERIGIVGQRIRALRLVRNMSIEDLGKKTSVSSVTISNIEKGIYSPKLSTVLELAKALGTTIIHLVEDVDEPRVFKIGKDNQRLESAVGMVLHDFSPIL
jgi:transcriptional regulator with XRE-family HTH domain